MIAGIGGAFMVAEISGFSGALPALQPVSLHEISSNILFAIGFGCPLVLQLSRLPRFREMAETAGLALALIGAFLLLDWNAVSSLPASSLTEWIVVKFIIAMGFSSMAVLAFKAKSASGAERTMI